MQLKIIIRKIHKWLGLIIGLQILFWTFGGLVMSSFPLEQVHGDHLHKEIAPEGFDIQALYPIVDLVKASDFETIEILTRGGFSGPQYRLRDEENKLHFYNAITGLALDPISNTQAITIAKSLYTGNDDVSNSDLITENSTEYRNRLPAWRIEFADNEAATFYIAVDSGELLSIRNSQWRIYDFVWMLHIMDYKDRTDFNSWLLICAAALALIIAFSGIYLVFKTFKKKDFSLGKS